MGAMAFAVVAALVTMWVIGPCPRLAPRGFHRNATAQQLSVAAWQEEGPVQGEEQSLAHRELAHVQRSGPSSPFLPRKAEVGLLDRRRAAEDTLETG